MRKVKRLFDRGKFDILLLQETRTDGSFKAKQMWKKIFNSSQIFLTKQGSNAVGAGVVIGSENIFKVSSHILDPLGRYAAVIGDHEEGKFLILSFTAPLLTHK